MSVSVLLKMQMSDEPLPVYSCLSGSDDWDVWRESVWGTVCVRPARRSRGVVELSRSPHSVKSGAHWSFFTNRRGFCHYWLQLPLLWTYQLNNVSCKSSAFTFSLVFMYIFTLRSLNNKSIHVAVSKSFLFVHLLFNICYNKYAGRSNRTVLNKCINK